MNTNKKNDLPTSFEGAVSILSQSEFKTLSEITKRRNMVFEKLSIVIKACNGDWVADMSDREQKKWYNYFYIDNRSLFCYDYTSSIYYNVAVPSALFIKDEETALYIKDTFFDLYEAYYL
jgi:hypothetical protein